MEQVVFLFDVTKEVGEERQQQYWEFFYDMPALLDAARRKGTR